MTTAQAENIVINTCIAAGLSPLQAFIVYSQGLQESGYNSHVFAANNNAFGMKFPRVRKSPYIQGRGTAAPAGESYPGDPYNYYAKFASLEDSVKDLLHRQNYFGINWKNIQAAEDYINFCKATKYFQGSLAIYKSNVAALLKKFANLIEKNPGSSVATVLLAIGVFF